jgi:mitosis inhibitor protein kinase SWE1
VLKHLSDSASREGLYGGHPNVLAYIDSWEEDEALYIQTELCESGSLSRFLWEYGKVFPRLDESRVWKIIVDLSNVSNLSGLVGGELIICPLFRAFDSSMALE